MSINGLWPIYIRMQVVLILLANMVPLPASTRYLKAHTPMPEGSHPASVKACLWSFKALGMLLPFAMAAKHQKKRHMFKQHSVHVPSASSSSPRANNMSRGVSPSLCFLPPLYFLGPGAPPAILYQSVGLLKLIHLQAVIVLFQQRAFGGFLLQKKLWSNREVRMLVWLMSRHVFSNEGNLGSNTLR